MAVSSTSREILNLDAAAEYIGASPRFVRKQVAERRIPYFKVGRLVRFERRDLDAFLDAGRVEPRNVL
jgi:excisionase family DNA binding protein